MYAIFLDHHGQVICEETNEDIFIYEKDIPFRPEKKNIFGRIIQTEKETHTKYHVKLNDRKYLREEYDNNAFRDPPEGYVRSTKYRYMKKNYWGMVKVLAFISDYQAKKIQKVLNDEK